jgi:hypothetical protein
VLRLFGDIIKRHLGDTKDLVEWFEPIDPLAIKFVHLDASCFRTWANVELQDLRHRGLDLHIARRELDGAHE